MTNHQDELSLAFLRGRLGLRRRAFTRVWWQVCDPVRQATLCSSAMGFPLRTMHTSYCHLLHTTNSDYFCHVRDPHSKTTKPRKAKTVANVPWGQE